MSSHTVIDTPQVGDVWKLLPTNAALMFGVKEKPIYRIVEAVKGAHVLSKREGMSFPDSMDLDLFLRCYTLYKRATFTAAPSLDFVETFSEIVHEELQKLPKDLKLSLLKKVIEIESQIQDSIMKGDEE